MDAEAAFRDRLRRAMDASGLEYQAIARAAGVNRPGTGSAWLRDSIPGGRALLRLPHILGVSGHWLLTGDGPMRPGADDVEADAYRRIAAIVRELDATAPATASDEVLAALDGQAGDNGGAAARRRSRKA